MLEWQPQTQQKTQLHTIFLLPHDNPLLLVVRGPGRLDEVRLGARKILGQVLEQRDGDFDVFQNPRRNLEFKKM